MTYTSPSVRYLPPHYLNFLMVNLISPEETIFDTCKLVLKRLKGGGE